jgi:CDP-diacylglycerol---glycerol-3-phosphate 3-phosphatidyltransferase
MQNLSNPDRAGYEKIKRGIGGRWGGVPRLGDGLWLAAILLFSPWLLSVSLCLPGLQDHPLDLFALLPGLAVAIHMQRLLSRHLGINDHSRRQEAAHPALGAADWITLLRASAVVLLAGFLPMAVQQGYKIPHALHWALGIIYLGISLADLLDGLVARKQGRETELGKRLDIETDAAGLLIASLLAVALGRLPAAYLLAGGVYYLFIFGIRIRQRQGLPLVALQQRPYSRIIAGFQMGLVGAALLPILNPVITSVAGEIFMVPLLLGFLRDWLVVSCRLETDDNQETTFDIRVRSFFLKSLPWILRFIVFSGGIIILAEYDGHLAFPFWKLAYGLCCLSAGVGFVGRSACLSLVLLLASDQLPFALSGVSMLVFSAAIVLMLIGTGALSLWSPEEAILYRRGGKGM